MIILSCGHSVNDFDHSYNVIVKATDRFGDKALAYKIVCGPCKDQYRQAGELFDNDDQANSWLQINQW